MHGAALAELLPTHPELTGWHYHKLHIKTEELSEALPLLLKLGFKGVNLTIPHKVAVIDLIDDLSPAATKAESVNTLVADGQNWKGYTTDGEGFLHALREYAQHDVQGREVLILGAGGAARAVAATCLDHGCERLTIANRDVAKAEALAGALKDTRVIAQSLASVSKVSPQAVIVNCTALGLQPQDPSPLDPALLQPQQFVFDTTYGKQVSALRQAAQKIGARHCDGRAMLRWQGALAFQLWTGVFPPMNPMRQALGESPA
jgi:shikimate dehydrogenase